MAAATLGDVIAGKDLILKIGTVAVAGATEFKYSITNKLGKVGPTSASFPKTRAVGGEVEEKITISYLVALTDLPLWDIRNACKAGTELAVEGDISTGKIDGKALIEGMDINGKVDDPGATGSATLSLYDTTDTGLTGTPVTP
jgi:hypothetical protein